MQTLIYVHDPMCSWCWAFAPAWANIRAALPDGLAVQTLLGGLAPDSDDPMPEDMRGYLQSTWQRIEQSVPGTVFNHAFWRDCQPRRSTWPACRAVCAAESLRPGAGEAMGRAIQVAYYTEAKNPSDRATLVALALAGAVGLPLSDFEALLDSEANRAEHARQMSEAQRLGVDSYPSLVLRTDAQVHPVPIDYNRAERSLQAIDAVLRGS